MGRQPEVDVVDGAVAKCEGSRTLERPAIEFTRELRQGGPGSGKIDVSIDVYRRDIQVVARDGGVRQIEGAREVRPGRRAARGHLPCRRSVGADFVGERRQCGEFERSLEVHVERAIPRESNGAAGRHGSRRPC